MNEVRQKRLDLLVDTLYGLTLCGLVYLLYRYLLGWMMPLVVGYAIAAFVHPLVERLCHSHPRHKKLAGGLVLLSAYGLLLALLVLLGAALLGWLQTLLLQLPDFYRTTLLPAARTLDALADSLLERIYPHYAGNALLQAAVMGLRDRLPALLGAAVTRLGALGAGLPGFLLTCAFSIVCSVLISMGYGDITGFLSRQFPRQWSKAIGSVKKGVFAAVGAWVRRIFLLALVTFLELAAGLWLLRVQHWLGAAAAISLLDLLPVLGVGGILLPWALITFLQGNAPLAAGLLILWIITAVVHGILELNMTGIQLGLHPLAGICTAYLGLKLMGAGGMVVFPMVAALAVELHRAGHIRIWK